MRPTVMVLGVRLAEVSYTDGGGDGCPVNQSVL